MSGRAEILDGPIPTFAVDAAGDPFAFFGDGGYSARSGADVKTPHYSASTSAASGVPRQPQQVAVPTLPSEPIPSFTFQEADYGSQTAWEPGLPAVHDYSMSSSTPFATIGNQNVSAIGSNGLCSDAPSPAPYVSPAPQFSSQNSTQSWQSPDTTTWNFHTSSDPNGSGVEGYSSYSWQPEIPTFHNEELNGANQLPPRQEPPVTNGTSSSHSLDHRQNWSGSQSAGQVDEVPLDSFGSSEALLEEEQEPPSWGAASFEAPWADPAQEAMHFQQRDQSQFEQSEFDSISSSEASGALSSEAQTDVYQTFQQGNFEAVPYQNDWQSQPRSNAYQTFQQGTFESVPYEQGWQAQSTQNAPSNELSHWQPSLEHYGAPQAWQPGTEQVTGAQQGAGVEVGQGGGYPLMDGQLEKTDVFEPFQQGNFTTPDYQQEWQYQTGEAFQPGWQTQPDQGVTFQDWQEPKDVPFQDVQAQPEEGTGVHEEYREFSAGRPAVAEESFQSSDLDELIENLRTTSIADATAVSGRAPELSSWDTSNPTNGGFASWNAAGQEFELQRDSQHAGVDQTFVGSLASQHHAPDTWQPLQPSFPSTGSDSAYQSETHTAWQPTYEPVTYTPVSHQQQNLIPQPVFHAPSQQESLDELVRGVRSSSAVAVKDPVAAPPAGPVRRSSSQNRHRVTMSEPHAIPPFPVPLSAIVPQQHPAGPTGVQRCPQCSRENDVDANFCMRCGGRMPSRLVVEQPVALVPNFGDALLSGGSNVTDVPRVPSVMSATQPTSHAAHMIGRRGPVALFGFGGLSKMESCTSFADAAI